MPASAPSEPKYYTELFYPAPQGWSPERLRRLYNAELSLFAKPEFRNISLLEVPRLVRHQIVPSAPVEQPESAATLPPEHLDTHLLGPAARKRARRAAAARHNEAALRARQTAANDD